MPRVVVSDLERPAELRPSRFTPDTFTGAPKPIIDNNMEQLASALQAFGASVSSFSAALGAKQQKAADDAATAEAHRIVTESGDPDFGKKVAAGLYPVQATAVGNGILQSEAGQRQARQALEEFRLRVADGSLPLIDKDGLPINLEQTLRSHASQYITSPNDPHFMKSFSGGVESGVNFFHDHQRQQVAEFNKKSFEQTTKNGIEEVIQFAGAGASDEQVAQKWAGLTGQAYKLTGTPPAEMDARWIGRLREMVASDDPKQWDTAERLLKLNRTGFDGQKLGPLASKPEFRKDVEEFASMLLQKRAGHYDKQAEEAVVARGLEALKQGDASFHGIQDVAYTNPFVGGAKDPNRLISASTIKQKAAARYEAESQEMFRRQLSDPNTEPGARQAFFERSYGAYVNNNIPHPGWKATLQDATRSLSDPTSASDPNFVKKLLEHEQLYSTLMERSPGYVKETLGIGEREQRFFDMIKVYRDSLGQSPEMAVKSAVRYINNPKPEMDAGDRRKIEEAVKRVDLNSWWPGGGITNTHPFRKEILNTALAVASDRDIAVEDAVKIARDLVQKRTMMFNGQAILSPHITQEKLPWVQKLLDGVFKENKEAIKASYDISGSKSLSIRPEAGGNFTVVTSDGEPVRVPVVNKNGDHIGYRLLQINANDINNKGVAVRQEEVDSLAKSDKKAREFEKRSPTERRLIPPM